MFDHFFQKYPVYSLVGRPNREQIEHYNGKLPDAILSFWRTYGWGIFMNGYLRFINPEELEEFADEYIEKIEVNESAIPFALTAFGDVFVYSSRGKIDFYNLRFATFEVVSSEKYFLDFFNNDLLDDDYIGEELKSTQFMEAKTRLGVPAYDQCYGYVPLLALGGPERVENIQILDLQTHLELMAQVVGPL